MGSNPMQKMKINSALIGAVVGLVIGLIICVIMYFILTNSTVASSINGDEKITVYALNRAVKSGETITMNDVVAKVMGKSDVPADAVSISGNVTAKINLGMGTIISSSMLNNTTDELTADLREQEYNMIALPTQLQKGDFIDIRLQLPNGGDYIVVAKKQILRCNSTTIWIKMNEEEILTMSNAIIEYYIMAGSKLYATKYTDPGAQNASIPTYCPNSEVVALINGDKNITSQIINGEGRYSDALKAIRNNAINGVLNNYSETRLQNIEDNIQEEIKTLRESRESYFGALSSAK